MYGSPKRTPCALYYPCSRPSGYLPTYTTKQQKSQHLHSTHIIAIDSKYSVSRLALKCQAAYSLSSLVVGRLSVVVYELMSRSMTVNEADRVII
eukprot:scaffold41593_cov146-Skeletonema_marinoi.AAC.2